MNTKELVAELKQLENSNGWKQLEKNLEDEIKRLEGEILGDDGISPYDNEPKFTQMDLLRSQRSIYKEMLTLPKTLRGQYNAVEELDLDL